MQQSASLYFLHFRKKNFYIQLVFFIHHLEDFYIIQDSIDTFFSFSERFLYHSWSYFTISVYLLQEDFDTFTSLVLKPFFVLLIITVWHFYIKGKNDKCFISFFTCFKNSILLYELCKFYESCKFFELCKLYELYN